MIVVIRQSRRAFVERADFVTSIGFGDGPGTRERLGLPGAGPRRVITDLGILEPDPGTCELTLTGIYPGVSVPDVRAATGWNLRVDPGLTEVAAPSEAELAALRALRSTKPSGSQAGSATTTPATTTHATTTHATTTHAAPTRGAKP